MFGCTAERHPLYQGGHVCGNGGESVITGSIQYGGLGALFAGVNWLGLTRIMAQSRVYLWHIYYQRHTHGSVCLIVVSTDVRVIITYRVTDELISLFGILHCACNPLYMTGYDTFAGLYNSIMMAATGC